MSEERIGHYQVLERIGAGAMGEVYRARDMKLDREVAIKVLPESFALRRESLVRFEREARILASLNHAHIASIYGIEERRGSRAIVMELVEGETLEQRLRRGPLELSGALSIFRQIAAALGAAHEKGIVHRDLKPGNIKFAADGTVKVLDFGLAKAVEGADEAAADSATLSTDTTRPGMVLGTPAYMSPEQTRGQAVDRRTDVWAFGCCLYEAVSGRKPFRAGTVSDMMAEVLKANPDYTLMPPETPEEIVSLLRRCLEKEPGHRLRDIGDIGIRLEEALHATPVPETKAGTQGSWIKGAAPLLVVGAAAASVTWILKPGRSPELPSPPPGQSQLHRHVRIDLGLGPGEHLPVDRGPAIRLSPDGERLVHIRRTGGETDLRRLYVQSLAGKVIEEPRLLEGTEGVYSFCFSPRGDEIAFLVPEPGNTVQSQLKIVSVGGGGARMVCDDLPTPADLAWEDDWIVFAVGSDTTGSIVRVSPTEVPAKPEPITELSEGELVHRAPQLLLGGQAVLYTSHRTPRDFTEAEIRMKELGSDGAPELLWNQGGYDVRYLPSGHVVYVLNRGIFAASFDPQFPGSLDPKPIIDNVIGQRNQARAQFDISDEGTLVYLSGAAESDAYHFTEILPPTRLEWVDRRGNAEPLLEADLFGQFELSSDGTLLAVSRSVGAQWDIYVYELEDITKPPKQMTFGRANDKLPVWGPNDQSIFFVSDRDGVPQVFSVPIDRPGDVHRVTTGENGAARFQVPLSYDSASRRLIMFESDGETSENLRLIRLESDQAKGWAEQTIEDFRATEASEVGAAVSRNGQWVAYVTNQDRSHHEVFVRRFSSNPADGGEEERQVSSLGVAVGLPKWSAEAPPSLTFATPDGRVHVVSMRFDDGRPIPGEREEWPGGPFQAIPKMIWYDLHPDGERLLVRRLAEQAGGGSSRVVLFENFFDYLRREVPRGEAESSH